MRTYKCQPSFYNDRSDTWRIRAADPGGAAERFQGMYDAEQGIAPGVPVVRVIFPTGREQLFEVRSVEVREYTAEEKK